MAASIIEQSPFGLFVPVGQDLIFVVSNQTAVANETRVKFVAEVYIGTSHSCCKSNRKHTNRYF
jgi:DNA-directed RNA polymerase subunit E'/Rpb7